MTEDESLNYPEKKKSQTYIVQAPPPSDPSLIPSIYWIELRDDQEVEWQWTELPDGTRVVTGYRLTFRKAFGGAQKGGGTSEN